MPNAASADSDSDSLQPKPSRLLFSVQWIVLACMAAGMLTSNQGIHSPLMILGLIPGALACNRWPASRAFTWCIPSVGVWVAAYGMSTGLWGNATAAASGSSPGFVLGVLLLALTALCLLIGQTPGEAGEEMSATERASHSLDDVLKKRDTESMVKTDRERFMGQLSHEIRTPVAALRNAVMVLKHPKASDTVKQRSLDLVDTTSEQLLSFLNDALDSFKYGSQQFSLNERMFDLPSLITDIELLFSGPATAKGVSLRSDLSGVRTPVVFGDSVRLRQMMFVLVGNAVKYTQAGEVCVRVISPNEVGDDWWRFEVIDTGCGIETGRQPHLFKPVVGGVQGVSGNAAATYGLGLTVVRQLAEAMGGSVGVTSRPGQGSTFWFEIRLGENNAELRNDPDTVLASLPQANPG